MMSSYDRMRRTDAAFTLIELLTVVAIILLLISLMVPSLGGVKEKGRAVICKNNLRQLHVAITLGRRANPDLRLCASTWMSLAAQMKGVEQTYICPDDDQGPYNGGLGTWSIKAYSHGTTWATIPLVEGPRAKKLMDLPGGGYRLGFEDWTDYDYNDLVVDVLPQGNGSVKLTPVSVSSSSSFDLMDDAGNVLKSNLKGSLNQGFDVQGGATSYGFNDVIGSAVESPQGGRPMLCDYERSEVKVSGIAGRDNWTDFFLAKENRYEFARHDGKMNVLFTDGSVTPYEPKDIDPNSGAHRQTFWGVE